MRANFQDCASGAAPKRPNRNACLDHTRPRDVLVVLDLDRLGRLAGELVTLVDDPDRRGIGFRALNSPFEYAAPSLDQRCPQSPTPQACSAACEWSTAHASRGASNTPARQASPPPRRPASAASGSPEPDARDLLRHAPKSSSAPLPGRDPPQNRRRSCSQTTQRLAACVNAGKLPVPADRHCNTTSPMAHCRAKAPCSFVQPCFVAATLRASGFGTAIN